MAWFRLLTDMVILRRIEPQLWGVRVESKVHDADGYTTFVVSHPLLPDNEEVFPEFEMRRMRLLPAKLHKWWLKDGSVVDTRV